MYAIRSYYGQISGAIQDIETEFCFYIDAIHPLDADESQLLTWLLSETFEPEKFSETSFLAAASGPRTVDYP